MNKFNLIRTKTVLLLVLITSFLATNIFSQKKMMMPSDGSNVKMSNYSFDETVDILKGAIEEQNLMVIYEVDGQKMMRMAGKEIKGMKQLFYFHPMYMRKVAEANKEAVIQIPFKFIIMEKPDGKVMIRYFMPSKLLANYKGEDAIAKELDQLVIKIVSEIMS